MDVSKGADARFLGPSRFNSTFWGKKKRRQQSSDSSVEEYELQETIGRVNKGKGKSTARVPIMPPAGNVRGRLASGGGERAEDGDV